MECVLLFWLRTAICHAYLQLVRVPYFCNAYRSNGAGNGQEKGNRKVTTVGDEQRGPQPGRLSGGRQHGQEKDGGFRGQ